MQEMLTIAGVGIGILLVSVLVIYSVFICLLWGVSASSGSCGPLA